MGVDAYGELSYYQTYFTLFVIFVGLSQEGAVARYFYFYGKNSMNLIINAGYLYSITVATVILLFCFFLKSEIIAYTVISSVFSVFLSVQLSSRQCQKKVKEYVIIQFLSAFIATGSTIITLELYQTELAYRRVVAALIANILTFAIVFFYSKKNSFFSFSVRKYKLAIKYLIAFGLPLIFHHISWYLRGQLDRVFIYNQFSKIDLGLYAMGAYIATLFSVLLGAINKATMPYYYEALKKKTITFKTIRKFIIFSLFIIPIPALVMLVIPEQFVVWLLGKSFEGTHYYIVMFLLSSAASIPYLILVNYLFFYGKSRDISISSILATAFYIVSLVLLVFFFKNIKLIPLASIIGAITIIPFLYFKAKKVTKEIE